MLRASARVSRSLKFVAQVFLTWIFQDGLSHETQIGRVKHLQVLLGDLASQLPSSSIDIERAHSNIQIDCATQRAVPKRPSGVQVDSYVCSAALEHAHLREGVETQACGHRGSRRRSRSQTSFIDSGGNCQAETWTSQGLTAGPLLHSVAALCAKFCCGSVSLPRHLPGMFKQVASVAARRGRAR